MLFVCCLLLCRARCVRGRARCGWAGVYIVCALLRVYVAHALLRVLCMLCIVLKL